MIKPLHALLLPGLVALLSACVQTTTTVGGGAVGTAGTSPSVAAVNPAPLAGDCSTVTALGPRYDATVDAATFDAALFDAAVLGLTNQRRCAIGVPPLAADSGLRQAASVHSADMVALNFYDHTSPAPGRTKMTDRLNGAGVSYRAAAENIGRASRLKLIGGKPYTVTDRATCSYAYDGVPIAAHSYRSLAEKLVQSWEGSSQHRQNLLGTSYTRLGTGASFKQNPQTCGDFIATQNFAA
jgi:uncharacterized protein YkwD